MKYVIYTIFLLAPSVVFAAIINVPQDYPTIQSAVNASSSGDEIVIAAGVYFESVEIDGKDLILRGAGSGLTIIDGSSGFYGLRLEDTSTDTIIRDLSIRNSFDGISAHSPFTLLFCEVYGNSHDGVAYEDFAGGSMRHCEIYQNGDDGIDIDHRVDVSIEDNVIHSNGSADENGQDGIEIRLHNDFIPSTLQIVIRNNTIDGNTENGIQIIDHSQNATDRVITIERNLICNNIRAGIGMMNGGDTDEDYRAASIAEELHIINNTVAGNNHGISGGDNSTVSNNLIVNNTVLGSKGMNGDSKVDYNMYFGNGSNDQGSSYLSNNIFGVDPLLNNDYTLTALSPAIDAADPSCFFPESASVCDIGASEFISVLPVELSYFEGNLLVNDVELLWETSSETNNLGFHVEIKSDQQIFRSLGFVEGKGTTSENQSYSFKITDLDPGVHTFRLRQIDYDGSQEYSSTLEFAVDMPEEVTLYQAYPNPFNPSTQVQFIVRESQSVDVALYSVLGERVISVFEGPVRGGLIQNFRVDAEGLAGGSYFLILKGQNFLKSQVLSLTK